MLDASSSENTSLANKSLPLETDATLHRPPHEVALDLDTREPSSRSDADQCDPPKRTRPLISRQIAHPTSIPEIGDNDLTALTFLFERYEMSEVEADLDRVLSTLTPEPYWEDENLEFEHHD